MSRRLFWLAPALAVGLFLRIWNLDQQVVGGDELHAVRRALTLPVSEILVTYHESDNCLPLTALYRLWIDSGRPLTERVLRMPVLISGIALLLLAPWTFRRMLGGRVAVLLTWLLAISPLLIHYSRTVRPYMPAVALGCLAAAAFFAWWRRGGWGLAVVHAVAAPLSVYFHPLVAPFVLAPVGFALVDLVARRAVPRRPSAGSLLGVGLAVAAGLLAFLLPARASLESLLENKAGAGSFDAGSVVGALQLFAGTTPVVAVAFWLVALFGWQRLARRDVGLACYGAWLVASQLLGLVVLEPMLLERSLVLTRYVLVLLPLALLGAAVGLDALLDPLEQRLGKLAASLTAASCVALLALAGPLAERELWTTSFSNHNDFVEFTAPRPRLDDARVPPFYLQDLPPGAVIEVPWPTSWWMGRTAHLYQRRHGRRVLVTPTEATLRDPRLAFRNYVFRLDQAVESGARFLVVHRDLALEECRLPDAAVPITQYRTEVRTRLRVVAKELEDSAFARWGSPDYEDDELRVWDLESVEAN